MHNGADDGLWQPLRSLDEYRRKFTSTPETLTNPVLLGTLLVPLGLAPQPGRGSSRRDDDGRVREPLAKLGSLPLARRDLERLRQILSLQRRLRDLTASVRAQRALTHRSIFREALTWMEIHGGTPESSSTGLPCWPSAAPNQWARQADGDRPRRRRRRRRRRVRPVP